MRDGQEGWTKKGHLGTFTVQIQYQENATWQGKILWVEGKQSCYFRSALEMLKLMDSALDTEDLRPHSQLHRRRAQAGCLERPFGFGDAKGGV